MTNRWLSIVGIGEDGIEGLSAAARTLIESADLLIGGERHLAMVPVEDDQERIAWTASQLLAQADGIGQHRGRPTCVLASGDPMWFGIGATLSKRIAAAAINALATWEPT